MTAVETSFDAAARAADGVQLRCKLAGVEVRCVDDPPVGALIVFSRRVRSKDTQTQIGAIMELIDRWVHADDLDLVYDAIAGLHAGPELQDFLQGDLARFVEAVAARPTWAQSS